MSLPSYPWNALEFMHESTLEVETGALQLVRNRPERPPELLLLHGVLRDWRSFYSILPALGPELSIAALDFRGHGGSAARRSYFVVDYVTDALEALRRLEQPCVVYGHSLGAMVALAAASAEPDRVTALILEDPPFSTMGQRLRSLPLLRYFQGVEACLRARQSPDPASMYEAFSNIIVGTADNGSPILVKDQRDEISRRFSAECLTRVDPAVMEPITSGRWLEGYDLERVLESVRCPVELLQADSSFGGMLTDDEAELITEKLHDRCRLRFFAKTGHSIQWSQPDEVMASVRGLVS